MKMLFDIFERPPKGVEAPKHEHQLMPSHQQTAAKDPEPVKEEVIEEPVQVKESLPVNEPIIHAHAKPIYVQEQIQTQVQEQAKKPVLDQNNPLKDAQTQNYITEKLLAHRQNLIDTYGSSKVPTPVMHVVKQMTLSSDSPDPKSQD